jgi:hypothetical protein
MRSRSAHHLQLTEIHMAGIGGTPYGAEIAEDIRDLQAARSEEPSDLSA